MIMVNAKKMFNVNNIANVIIYHTFIAVPK